MSIEQIGRNARKASLELGSVSSTLKNDALKAIARALRENRDNILSANQKDMVAAKEKGAPAPFLDRLLLTQERLEEMAVSLEEIAIFKDPIGEVVGGWKLKNGLEIKRVRVALGVIGIIYEARPNVTIEAFGLCLKAANASILRGGSSAINSNKALIEIINKASEGKIPQNSVQLITDTSHEVAEAFMSLKELDILIPRGGEELIKLVSEKAKVPVLWAAAGNCHTYVDKDADLEMALKIVINAKTQRPGVCNAMETLLVHKDIARQFLPKALEELKAKGVEIRGDSSVKQIDASVKEATDEDYYTEFEDLILAVKVVSSVMEAIEHINKYGTLHSEAIVTENYAAAKEFTSGVDAACVYVNASTRFTDGGQFGFGGEIGINTQKLHFRGPMGIEALTSTKYIIEGNGQIRE